MSNKILVIAEKPSVALDYKKALSEKDQFTEHKGYYEGEKYIISYSVGHLLTIADPREIDISFKSWSMNVLPILPKNYPIRPIKTTEAQLKILIKLIARKDIEMIVNGCDAGREGELIFRYIMEYAKEKAEGKPMGRLWLQSMTQESIRDAFKNINDAKTKESLYDAAKSRAEADWVVGINASRALTAYQSSKGGFVLTPCGRVQTPTLMMIVNRDLERQSFVSKPYYYVNAVLNNGTDSYDARWYDPKQKEKIYTIWDERKAKEIVTHCKNKSVTDVKDTQKQSTQRPPLLYDLTTLQREANSRFGFSAKMTLSIVQSLYETHKLITYPRTSSKYLPQDYRGVVIQTLKNLEKDPLVGAYATKALKNNYLANVGKNVFDDSKVSDHFAIIPTTVGREKKKLVERQEKIYQMIVQRFIGVFYPPAKYLNTTRVTEIEGEFFKTEGKILVEPGFKEIYSKEQEDIILSHLDPKTSYLVKSVVKEDLETKPPSHYTESTLLSAMEGAGKFIDDEELKEAIKETGIGTPATRASIIEKLVEDKYMVREQGHLLATHKAFRLHDLIFAMNIQQLGSAELTGGWESKLGKIESRELTRAQFMKEIETAVKDIVSCVKNFSENNTLKKSQFQALGQFFDETLSEYLSQDQSIVIRKVIGGRQLSTQDVIELLEKKKLGPLEGFRSRRGFPFSATLILDAENKVQFKFEEEINLEDIKNYPVVGKSPIDQSDVYMLDTQYIAESALTGDKKGFKLSRIILGKEISLENLQKILNGQKTELIKGFRSTKSKRLFDAYLNLSEKGAIEFSFEEKKSKRKTTKKATTAKSTKSKTLASKSSVATKKATKTKTSTTKLKESAAKKVTKPKTVIKTKATTIKKTKPTNPEA